LVDRADAAWGGLEVEVSPVGDDCRRTHAVLHRHEAPSGAVHAAVFGELPAGDYRLWHRVDDR
jgi:hypothetical protein